MSDLNDLYQQVIIDHGRKPRNFGKLANANHIKEGYNPLCGDKLTVYLREENNQIIEAQFEGEGCAISMASASLMTEALKNKTLAEAEILFGAFHELLTNDGDEDEKLGKLLVLAGVKEYPMRVKCATLCWHTARAAWKNEDVTVSTEL